MIISHRHKFIFMHCPKAAGSSITVSLSRYLGPDDIQIGSHHDCMSFGMWPKREARRQLLSPRGLTTLVSEWTRTRNARLSVNNAIKSGYARKIPLPMRALPHPTADIVQRAFPEEWKTYFKFGVTRNPYERLVSEYYWVTAGLSTRPSFMQFLEASLRRKKIDGLDGAPFDTWGMYAINGDVAIDKFVAFDGLEDNLADALLTVGVEWDKWLPKLKAAHKPEKGNLWTPEALALVRQIGSPEIDYFGYEPPLATPSSWRPAVIAEPLRVSHQH